MIEPAITEVPVLTYGPEPIGAAQASFLLGRAIEDASGRNNPVGLARGPEGDPSRSAVGDLGALQEFTALRTVAQPGTVVQPMTALPSTSSGAPSIQDTLGTMGI